MANRYVPYRQGYIEVMNGKELYAECDAVGARTERGLGEMYTHDTIYGLRRIHTRVKTVGIRGFMHERKHQKLVRVRPR